MERCVIVDYGFLQSQLSVQGNSKRVPSEPQSHHYLRKVLSCSWGGITRSLGQLFDNWTENRPT